MLNIFSGCSSLTSVIIGSGVLSIGSSAFYNTNLKKTIWLTNTPPSGYSNASGTVNYVSNDQFNISNKVVYKYLSSYFDVGGIRYVPVSPSDRTCDAIDCIYDESAENINIGETVTNKGITLTVMKVNPYTCYQNKYIKDVKLSLSGDVGDYAFYGCTGLNTATVSNKGSIGSYAFNSCSALTTATISNQGNIGDLAFNSCSALTISTISNQGDIGKSAFSYCRALTTATISNQGDIGVSAFSSCSALTTAYINNQGGIRHDAFSGCSLLETAELGQNVTSIGRSAFGSCSQLKSIVIPDAVTSIGSYAFSGCSSMTSAKIGNGVETIDERTFSGCSTLTEINIGSKVNTINQYAFNECSALPSITIPQAVTTIGNNVFYNCTSLAKVTIADSETTLTLGSNGSSPIFSFCPLDYVYIGRDISYQTSSSYGYSPFYRNTSLREVKITDKETEISDNEFYGCTNLQQMEIGDGVTTIGKWAFSGCQSLKFFAFGSQVAEIGEEAFSDCAAMVEVISKAKTAPACGSQALDDINKWECKLYVPNGCMAVYDAAEQWKEFFFKDYVKVKLNKTKATIENGKTLTLKATVTPSDLSDKSVTWKSSNKSVATVTSKGTVKGVKAGTATITCTSTMTGAKATCKVTVTEKSIELDKTEAVLEKGKTVTLKATVYPSTLEDKTVTWESSNTKVATVSSAGKVKGVKTGTATITCTSNATGAKATCEVTVGSVKLNQTEVIVNKGKTVTLKATVYPTTLEDKTVAWTSSNTAVATVSSKGKVKGVKTGTATITCTSNATGLSTTCEVTVGSVKLNQTEVTVNKGKTVTLKATVYPTTLEDKTVTWTSSNTAVATVSSSGKVKGVKTGTATITCTSNATGLSATCEVTVIGSASSRALDGDDDDELTGIEENVVAVEPFDVYDLSGRKVLHQVTSLDGLPDGIYIVNGKKILKKK